MPHVWQLAAGLSSTSWPTSFEQCPNDDNREVVNGKAPLCVDDGVGCDTRDDFLGLRSFAKAIDESVGDDLAQVTKARKSFERRACDLRYAEMMNKSLKLIDTYGPHGPMGPGGSYLFELKNWSRALHRLYHRCLKGSGSCINLITHLREHPDEDVDAAGTHGKVGSTLYKEFRLACQVGKTRAPVPNDSPVWCDEVSGLCEKKSCKKWWGEVHPEALKPRPWVDDRIEYNSLRSACEWIEDKPPSDAEINAAQHQLQRQVDQLHEEYCKPKWVEGYCESGDNARKHADCKIDDSSHCKKGLILPGSEQDATANWEEKFKNPPVRLNMLFHPAVVAWSPRPLGLRPVGKRSRHLRNSRPTTAVQPVHVQSRRFL